MKLSNVLKTKKLSFISELASKALLLVAAVQGSLKFLTLFLVINTLAT